MSEADSLAEDSLRPPAEGTAKRHRSPRAPGSHWPLEDGRPPVLVAGRAAGWGCTGSPLGRIGTSILSLKNRSYCATSSKLRMKRGQDV